MENWTIGRDKKKTRQVCDRYRQVTVKVEPKDKKDHTFESLKDNTCRTKKRWSIGLAGIVVERNPDTKKKNQTLAEAQRERPKQQEQSKRMFIGPLMS